jgi:glycosyltransferase involved in cell wall biosynthesis
MNVGNGDYPMKNIEPRSDAPLVSIAVITYNQAAFLDECLKSILSQDYENLQIVVADDGSSDGSQELLREYERRHPEKFTLCLAEENKGITPNSNAAHFAAKGRYVAWMGGDDIMLPGKISAQVELMEADPEVTICYHDLDIFESDSGESLGRFSSLAAPRSGTFEEVVGYGAFNGACSTMVRRNRVPHDGFDPRLPIASDWLYWMQTLRNGGRIAYLDRILGRYRRHGANITGSVSRVPLQNFQDHLAAVAYLLAENPEVSGELMRRQADLLRGLRNSDDGNRYYDYLKASLRSRFNWKSAAGLLAALLGKRF